MKKPNLKPTLSRVIFNFLKIFPLCTKTVKPIKLWGMVDALDQIYKFFLVFARVKKNESKKKPFQIERAINTNFFLKCAFLGWVSPKELPHVLHYLYLHADDPRDSLRYLGLRVFCPAVLLDLLYLKQFVFFE